MAASSCTFAFFVVCDEGKATMAWSSGNHPSASQSACTQVAVIAIEADGRIASWNDGASKLYGCSAAEVVGQRNFASFLHSPPHAESLASLLRTALERGGLGEVQQHLRHDGQPFAVDVVIAPLDSRASFLCFCQEVRQAATVEIDWLARQFHDLRTPLNGILGFAALLHGGKLGSLSATQAEYVGDILTCARQLMQLMNDLETQAGEKERPA